MIHQVNIAIHVLAGTVGIIIGLITIFFFRRPGRHRQFGRYFLWLLSVVVVTGFLGWLFYRQNPFLLMLTLLSGYVGYAGYRAVRLREAKGSFKDAAISLLALSVGILYLSWLQQTKSDWSPTVIYSTLGALLLVTVTIW